MGSPFPNWKRRRGLEEWAERWSRDNNGQQLPRAFVLCEVCDVEGHDLFGVPSNWSGIYKIEGGRQYCCPCCLGKHPKFES